MIEAPEVVIDTNNGNTSNFQNWKTMSINYKLGSLSANLTLTAIDNPIVIVDSTNRPVRWSPDSKIEVYTTSRSGLSSKNNLDPDTRQKIFTGRIDRWTTSVSNETSTTISARSTSSILQDSFPPRDKLDKLNGASPKTFIKGILEEYDLLNPTFVSRANQLNGNIQNNSAYDRLNLLDTAGKNLTKMLNSINNQGVVPLVQPDGELKFYIETPRVQNSNTDGFSGVFDSEDENLIINCESGSYSVDMSMRFHDYEALGQSQLTALTTPGEKVSERFQSSEDQQIKFEKRLLREQVSGNYNNEQLQSHADFMKNRAYARARKAKVKISGWRYSSGKFVFPGQICKINGPFAERLGIIDNDWLIDEVTYSFSSLQGSNLGQSSNGGTRTEVSLIKREAFSRAPSVENTAPGSLLDTVTNNN